MAINEKTVMENGEEFRVRQVQREKIVAGLTAGVTIKELASELHMKADTIYNIMREPKIQDSLKKNMKIIHATAVQKASENISDAFDTVNKAIKEGDAKIALALLDKMGVLKSAGDAGGFEIAEIQSSMPKIVINISGHSSDDSANIIDITSDDTA